MATGPQGNPNTSGVSLLRMIQQDMQAIRQLFQQQLAGVQHPRPTSGGGPGGGFERSLSSMLALTQSDTTNLFSNLRNAFKDLSSVVLDPLKSAGRGLVSLLQGDLIGAASGVVGVFTSIIGSGFKLAGALAGLTLGMVNLAKQFKEFSPSLSIGFALADMRQILRSQRIGEGIAPSVNPLLDSIEDLKDTFEPILIDLVSIGATIAKVFVDLVRMLANVVMPIWDAIKEVVQAIYDAIAWVLNLPPMAGGPQNPVHGLRDLPGAPLLDPNRGGRGPIRVRPVGA